MRKPVKYLQINASLRVQLLKLLFFIEFIISINTLYVITFINANFQANMFICFADSHTKFFLEF